MTRLSELLGDAVGFVEPTFGVDDIERRVKRRRRTRGRRVMAAAGIVALTVVGSAVILVGGRSSSPQVQIQPSGPTAPTTMALPPAGNSNASLRATAIALANALLVGSVDDIHA